MINFLPAANLYTQSSKVPQQAVTSVEPDVTETDNTTENEAEPVNSIKPSSESSSSAGSESRLSDAEKKQIQELRARDREVRAHEQAHAAAAGALAKGAPAYEYQKGPDGQLYAVGGHVSIDTSAVSGDPKATLDKAGKIQRAALAPSQPSQQDRAVAAQAAALASQARAELAQERSATQDTSNSELTTTTEDTQGAGSEKVKARCAECGGQHSSDSHAVSLELKNTFDTGESQNTLFDIAA